MNTRILTVVFLVAATAPALAQSGKVTVGVSGGGVTALSGTLDTLTDTDLSVSGHVTLDLLDLMDPLVLRAEIGRHELNTTTPNFDFCDALGARCQGDVRFTNLSVGVQYGGSADRPVLGWSHPRVFPYLFGTVGVYRANQLVFERFSGDFSGTALPHLHEAQEPPPPPHLSTIGQESAEALAGAAAFAEITGSHLGFNAGGGINVRLNRYVQIHGELQLHGVNLGQTDLPGWASFVTPSVGLALTF